MLESRAPHVSVDGFEGPLDLLLELIEEQRLDILTVRLGDLAETYLARVRAMAELPAEEVAAFLVLAARLVLIKARSILPQASPEELESAETDEAELRQRLLEYQAVRERAGALRDRLNEGRRAFHREGGSPVALPPRGGNTGALAAAWQKVLALARTAPVEELVAPGERYSVEDRAVEIEEILRARSAVSFSTLLLERPTVRFAIVTFLAILDLFRRSAIDLEQAALFDDITVRRRGPPPADG